MMNVEDGSVRETLNPRLHQQHLALRLVGGSASSRLSVHGETERRQEVMSRTRLSPPSDASEGFNSVETASLR